MYLAKRVTMALQLLKDEIVIICNKGFLAVEQLNLPKFDYFFCADGVVYKELYKKYKQELDKINNSFINDDLNQARIITAELKLKKKKIELINIYVPNGNPVDTEKYEYKKEWLKRFISSVKKKIQKNSNILIAGDFNIIPEEIDVHDFKRYENDALGRLEIRKKYRELINLGFKDVYRFKNKTKQEYTFWDYFAGSWQKNYGMRIDHFLLSNNLIENIKSININKKPRSKEKPSDHTPIELEII